MIVVDSAEEEAEQVADDDLLNACGIKAHMVELSRKGKVARFPRHQGHGHRGNRVHGAENIADVHKDLDAGKHQRRGVLELNDKIDLTASLARRLERILAEPQRPLEPLQVQKGNDHHRRESQKRDIADDIVDEYRQHRAAAEGHHQQRNAPRHRSAMATSSFSGDHIAVLCLLLSHRYSQLL